jgi:hypothetical protein
MLREVYSELPEVNWGSCGFDVRDEAGNAAVYHYI